MSVSRRFGYYPAPGSVGAPRMERLTADDGSPIFSFPDLSAEEEAVYKRSQIYRNWETMMLHNMKDAKVGTTPKKVLPKENRKRKQYEQNLKVQKEMERKRRMDEFDEQKKEWLAKLKANKRKTKRGRKKVEVIPTEEEEEKAEDEEESDEETVYKPYDGSIVSPPPTVPATSPPVAAPSADLSPSDSSGLTSPAESIKAESPVPARAPKARAPKKKMPRKK